ncbi:MAG: ABC transporter permease [Pseudomonadota bacterium]
MKLLLEIATLHVLGRGRQTLISVLGVATGVGFSVAMAALMQGSQDSFTETLIDAIPHVQITDDRRRAPQQPADRAYDLAAINGLRPVDDPRGVLNPTATVAGLRAWVPGEVSSGLSLSSVARFGGGEAGVSVLGVEPAEHVRVSSIREDMVVGDLEDLRGHSAGAVLGRALIERLGAEAGDSVTLIAGSGQGQRFKVVGVFDTGNVSTDEGRVFVLLKNAQVLANRPNAVNDIRVRLDDPFAAREIAARAESLTGYKSVSWQEANGAILENFKVRNIIMYAVVGAILLVAGFGVFSIVSTITHEKSRDIAIMKSLGFTAFDIERIFVLEGVSMGLAGSTIGWGLGYGLTRGLELFEIEVPGQREAVYLPVAIDPLHYLIATAIAVGSAAVAGWLPARKAARLNPVDIIRGAT